MYIYCITAIIIVIIVIVSITYAKRVYVIIVYIIDYITIIITIVITTSITFIDLCIMTAFFTEKLIKMGFLILFAFVLVIILKEMMCVSFVSGQIGSLIRVHRHSLLLHITVLVVIDQV